MKRWPNVGSDAGPYDWDTMIPSDDRDIQTPPQAMSVGAKAAGRDLKFMSGQVRVMREECPEIWCRIDAMSDRPFDPAVFEALFLSNNANCLCCKYDLRGNTSGICPECGTPVHMTPEARRLIAIRILDKLRTTEPERWLEVSDRLEREHKENIRAEFEAEGARRDQIRRTAMKSWLDRKRGAHDNSAE